MLAILPWAKSAGSDNNVAASVSVTPLKCIQTPVVMA